MSCSRASGERIGKRNDRISSKSTARNGSASSSSSRSVARAGWTPRASASRSASSHCWKESTLSATFGGLDVLDDGWPCFDRHPAAPSSPIRGNSSSQKVSNACRTRPNQSTGGSRPGRRWSGLKNVLRSSVPVPGRCAAVQFDHGLETGLRSLQETYSVSMRWGKSRHTHQPGA
jgi:hypothetical protein